MNVLEPDNFAPSSFRLVLGHPGSAGSAASWILVRSLLQAGVVELGWLLGSGLLHGGSVLRKGQKNAAGPLSLTLLSRGDQKSESRLMSGVIFLML